MVVQDPVERRPRTSPLDACLRAAWRTHAMLLPLLHATDPIKPSNTCVNLQVLWLKALAGARGETSDDLSYRFLPKKGRILISRPLCWLYPPWHHTTIARRTRFIDETLNELVRDAEVRGTPLHFVTVGAGFDTRPLRLGGGEHSWVEVDLPAVVEQKRRMLSRLTRARPWLAPRTPELRAADLSTASGRAVVYSAAAGAPNGSPSVVFVCEAVLMYLPERRARELLQTCGRFQGAHVVFADRLPGSIEDRTEAVGALQSAGLTLRNWEINSNVRARRRGSSRHGQIVMAAHRAGDARALKLAGARVSAARHMGLAVAGEF